MPQTSTEMLRQMLVPSLRARGLQGADASWSFLEGGRTNWLWRVSRPGGDIVVKLYSGETSNPLFPNDPRSEVKVLTHLEGHGIAPQLLESFQTDAGACLIYAHLSGTAGTADCAKVASLLHRLHRIAPPPGLRKVPDGSAALRQQTLAILAACADEHAASLRILEPADNVAPSGVSCLLHADPVPANMIDQGGELKLIDWQCPAIGDPCEDIAIFLSPAMQITYGARALTAAERADFLDGYHDHRTIQRYRQLEPWYHWRMAAYCLWNEARGDKLARRAYAAETEALRAAQSEQI